MTESNKITSKLKDKKFKITFNYLNSPIMITFEVMDDDNQRAFFVLTFIQIIICII